MASIAAQCVALLCGMQESLNLCEDLMNAQRSAAWPWHIIDRMRHGQRLHHSPMYGPVVQAAARFVIEALAACTQTDRLGPAASAALEALAPLLELPVTPTGRQAFGALMAATLLKWLLYLSK